MPRVNISNTAPWARSRQNAPASPRKRTMPPAGANMPTCAAGTVASKVVMRWLPGGDRDDWDPTLPHRAVRMRGFRNRRHQPGNMRRPQLPRGGSTRQDEILEPLAQHCLLDLAGRGVWNLIDENDVVGHPPVGNLAAHEFQDLIPGGGLILPENDDEQRPLVPLRMLHADHRCVEEVLILLIVGLGHAGSSHLEAPGGLAVPG